MMKKYLLEPFKITNNIRPNRYFCIKRSRSNIIMNTNSYPFYLSLVAGVSLLWIGMSFESGEPECSQHGICYCRSWYFMGDGMATHTRNISIAIRMFPYSVF